MAAAFKNHRRLCFAAAVFLPLGHAGALEFEPGTWKEIETGTEDGKWAPPTTNTTCMTPEQAEDPLKALAPDKDLAAVMTERFGHPQGYIGDKYGLGPTMDSDNPRA